MFVFPARFNGDDGLDCPGGGIEQVDRYPPQSLLGSLLIITSPLILLARLLVRTSKCLPFYMLILVLLSFLPFRSTILSESRIFFSEEHDFSINFMIIKATE